LEGEYNQKTADLDVRTKERDDSNAVLDRVLGRMKAIQDSIFVYMQLWWEGHERRFHQIQSL